MKRALIVLAAVVLSGAVVAYWKGRSGSGGAPRPVAVGHAGGDAGASLRFGVSNVRRNQRLVEGPPYFELGGDWTVFDCTSVTDSKAVFTVAVEAPRLPEAKGPFPVAFGKAAIAVADREAGVRIAGLFEKAFGASAPPKSPQPLKPLVVSTAVLGNNLAADPGGSFSAEQPGSWTATKWFLQNDGYDAEVFFNYDLTGNVAEFTEKDADYAEDLVGALAAALRDGPRPMRTPENDANLTLDGPKVGQMKAMPNTKGYASAWTADSRLILIEPKGKYTRAFLADPAALPARVELAQVDNHIDHVVLVDRDAQRVLVEERIQPDPNTVSADDPRRIWLVTTASLEKRRLTGPWGEKGSIERGGVSPEAPFVAISHYQIEPARRRPVRVLHFYDLSTHRHRRVDPPEDGEVVGWVEQAGSARAVFLTGFFWEPMKPRRIFLIDPLTGHYEPPGDGVRLPREADPDLSPDGKRRMRLTPHDHIEVSDLDSRETRTFIFHEDDQRFAEEQSVRWVSPDYLSFAGPRLAFIHAVTMKMNYPLPLNGNATLDFSPDFRWAVRRSDEGLAIGPVPPN